MLRFPSFFTFLFIIASFFSSISFANPSLGRFNASSCTANSSVCIAVGFLGSDENNTTALLMKTNDRGKTWQTASDIANFPKNKITSFLTAYCTVSGKNSICMAAGYIGPKYDRIPLLVRSIDNGATWQTVTFDKNQVGLIKHLTCSGGDKNLFCVAVGWKATDYEEHASIWQSIDAGETWQFKKIVRNDDYRLLKTSCVGNKNNSICVAIDFFGSRVFASFDAGSTWNEVTIPFTERYSVNDVQCIGKSRESAHCRLVGAIDYRRPFVLETRDGGRNWIPNVMKGFPVGDFGGLYNINCFQEKNQEYCFTGGYGMQGYDPLLVQSKDGGLSWDIKSFTPPLKNGAFETITCTKDIANKYCIAISSSSYGYNHILTDSVDSGNSWKNKGEISGITDYRNPTCVGKGLNTYCLIVGYNNDDYPSTLVLVQTQDRGAHLEVKTF